MACVLKGSRSFTCTSTRSSAIGMSHTCLCLPSYLPTPRRLSWLLGNDGNSDDDCVDVCDDDDDDAVVITAILLLFDGRSTAYRRLPFRLAASVLW